MTLIPWQGLKESNNESELLAKKLVFAWTKDPSLGLVLRKAIEIYPSSELFEPVFEAIYSRSSFNEECKATKITKAMMDYPVGGLISLQWGF